MSIVNIKLRGNRSTDIRTVTEALKAEITCETACENWRTFDELKICLLSFERYYWRNESTASLTIMLTEHDNIQTADVIASAGGRGIFNISRGANSDFAQDASDILERHGFKKEQEKKY